MKNTLKFVLIILFCAALVGGVVYLANMNPASGEEKSGKKKPPPLVEVQPVRPGPIAQTIDLNGEVVATNRVVMSAMKEGPIVFCPWREGDRVQAGETLVRIERASLEAEAQAARAALATARAKLDDLLAGARPEEIRRAEASLRKAEAALAEARRNYERQSELIRTETVSQETLDKARERLEMAEADVAALKESLAMLKAGPTKTAIAVQKAAVGEAEARLALTEAHLAECVITAPFDAIVSEVYARPGDTASSREPLIEIYDPASLVIRFAVSEIHAFAIEQDMPLDASLDALPGKSLAGKITRIYPELDPVTRTRMVEATLSDAAQVAPNMFARLSLTLTREEKALVVPSEAIVLSAKGQRTLFVIEDGKAVRRPVTTGIEEGLRVQVLSGVKPGEKVVVAGQQMLKPNMAVRLAGEGGAKSKKPGAQSEGSRAEGQGE